MGVNLCLSPQGKNTDWYGGQYGTEWEEVAEDWRKFMCQTKLHPSRKTFLDECHISKDFSDPQDPLI